MKKSIIFLVDDFPKNTNQIAFLKSFSKLKKNFKLILFFFEKNNQNINRNLFNKIFDVKLIATNYFFYQLVKKISPKIILNLREENFLYLKKIKKKNYTLATFQQGNLPFEIQKLSLFFFLKNIIFFLKINKIKNQLYFFFYKITRRKNIKYDIFFCGSKIIYNQAKAENKSYKLIKGHSYDYEEFLYFKKKKNFLQTKLKRYFVFIDNGMFFEHPDLKKFNLNISSTNNYRSEINKFLNHISNFYNLKIIILGHPKNKDKKKLLVDFYNNKNIFFDRSCDLIKNSSLVVAHSSTAISFAILFNKPIIFLTSNEIVKFSWPHKYIISQAYETGSPIINISKFFRGKTKIDLVSKINFKKYESYYYKYLCCNKSSKFMAEKIIKEFLKINLSSKKNCSK
jgi:hypothetical protein